MNHFKVCHDLILVTNANKKTVEKAIELLKDANLTNDFQELVSLLSHLGFHVTWDNWQDLESISL